MDYFLAHYPWNVICFDIKEYEEINKILKTWNSNNKKPTQKNPNKNQPTKQKNPKIHMDIFRMAAALI